MKKFIFSHIYIIIIEIAIKTVIKECFIIKKIYFF